MSQAECEEGEDTRDDNKNDDKDAIEMATEMTTEMTTGTTTEMTLKQETGPYFQQRTCNPISHFFGQAVGWLAHHSFLNHITALPHQYKTDAVVYQPCLENEMVGKN